MLVSLGERGGKKREEVEALGLAVSDDRNDDLALTIENLSRKCGGRSLANLPHDLLPDLSSDDDSAGLVGLLGRVVGPSPVLHVPEGGADAVEVLGNGVVALTIQGAVEGIHDAALVEPALVLLALEPANGVSVDSDDDADGAIVLLVTHVLDQRVFACDGLDAPKNVLRHSCSPWN